jgi:hypothetical protein
VCFGPETANIFIKMIGLQEVRWGNKNDEDEEKHKSHLVSDNKFKAKYHFRLYKMNY